MRCGWLWLLFLLSLSGQAQVPYGNEWITPSAHYLRLGVSQTGWYQLQAADLQKQGVELTQVLPRSLQLYRRGQPVAMLVQDGNDGKLDVTDYLEFYGERNDGLLDTSLYVAPQALPHSHYSLYSDTAAYFLSWRTPADAATAPAGTRVVGAAHTPTPAQATYHLQTDRQLFTSDYPAGTIYPLEAGFNYENGYFKTPYDYGEGWTGPARTSGQWEALHLQTVHPAREAFDRAAVEILFVGRSFGPHRVEVWAGDATKRTRKLGEVVWNNFDAKSFRASLLAEDLNGTGILSLVYTPTRAGESVSASYVQWSYPQQIQLPAAEDQKRINPLGPESFLVESADSLRFFDVTNPSQPRQLPSTYASGKWLVTPGTSQSMVVVKKNLSVTNLRKITFRNLDSKATNYLIVTHPLVRQPVAGSTDPVAEYATYRASRAGGGFVPVVMNADEVADQFNYGEPGPSGTRKLIRWLHDRGSLRYVFLMGRSRSPQIVRHQSNARSEDMVPSAGWPDSDIALAMGLDPANPHIPLVPIGRLNAYSSQNVWDYLQKVKQHEATPAAAPWRKNVLHLSGGLSGEELSDFRGYVDSYAQRVLSSPVAPELHTISKKTNEPVERFAIAPRINEGVALMTLFGHSSLNITDIDIGFASDNALGYRNKGRYPAVLVNGCALGNFYFGPTPISTDWILTPDRGAVLFLAHTHNGLPAAMYRYSDSFYDALSDPDFTSRGFGDIMQESIRRYLASYSSVSDQVTAQQMNLQGDPAIQIFPAPRPDYAWNASSVRITNAQGEKASAWNDSIRVSAVVANFGRFLEGKYTVQIRRKTDSRTLADYTLTRPAFPLRDTLRLMLPNDSRQGGNETWELLLDPQNSIEEEDETNNVFSLPIRIEEGGALALLPEDGAVIRKPTVDLVAQLPGSRPGVRVVFEWGLGPEFGANVQRDTVQATGVVARRTIVLTAPAPQRVYWRVGIVGDSTSATRTFSYDPSGPATGQPEGVATVVGTYPGSVEEGGTFSAQVAFENLADVPFRDSIQISIREFWGNSIREKRLLVPPLGARSTYTYQYTTPTLGKLGPNRLQIQFNSGPLPELVYANNTTELRYEVVPDQLPPVLDVVVDGRRLGDQEAVSPQPTLQIQVFDSNPYLLRSDTTGLRVSLRELCTQCPTQRVSLAKARWSPTPTSAFSVELDVPTLTPGAYLLMVQAQDLKGNEAAPYQIRFRVVDKNKVLSATASPNPADVWVKFTLDLEGSAPPLLWRVRVLDTQGKEIIILDKKPTLGKNELFWMPFMTIPGVYLYRMELEGNGWNPEDAPQGKILFRP